MTTRKKTRRELLRRIDELEKRLYEAEETVRAIRQVDAIVVAGKKRKQVVSLSGAESLYRLIVETIKEAAFTLTFAGRIVCCNAQFSQFVRQPAGRILGHSLDEFVSESHRKSVASILEKIRKHSLERRLLFRAADGSKMAAYISANVLDRPDGMSLCVVAGDRAELENPASLMKQLRQQQEALKESESRFKAVFLASHDAILLADDQATIVDCNPAAERLFGIPLNGLIGTRFGRYLRSNLKFDSAWSAFRREGRYRGELKLIRPDGEVIHTEFASVAKILPGRHLAIIHDVSERKRAEKEAGKLLKTVQDERDRLSALIDSIQDEVWFANEKGQLTLVNRAAVEEFGESIGGCKDTREIVARFEIYHPDGTPCPTEEAPPLRALRGEIIRNEEEIIRTPAKGELRHRQIAAAPVKNSEGRIIGAVLVAHDVTERRRSEEALRLSEKKYRQLFNSMTEGFLLLEPILDPSGKPVSYRFLESNPALAPLTHLKPEEIIGKDVREILPNVEPYWIDAVARVAMTGKPEHIERFSKDLDGWYDAYLYSPEHGKAALIYRNTTERKRAEKALQESEARLLVANADLERKVQERTAELVRRAAQLRALAGELTLTEQRERRRLANLLHDHLQQLLVGAKFGLTALGKTGDGPQREAIKELEQVIDESISAARSLTAELSPPILHEAGLNAGLQWLAKRMAEKHGLSVTLEMEEAEPLPDDIRLSVFESIRELLFNIAKHAQTPAGCITLRRAAGWLRVTVSDQGVGFDADAVPRAGESGGGFGLFAVRERLELFGGKLEIASTRGRGSRIVLAVPITQSTAAEPPSSKITAPSQKRSPGARSQSRAPVKRIRVLLADDHKILRQGIATLISNESDIEIVGEASDGLETVDLAARLAPDVILMDVSMPKLNGTEATRLIHKRFPDIHIIGLSMYEEAERAQAMRDAGAAAYISKSGPAEALINAIRKSVRRPGMSRSAGRRS